jgi:alpha-1,2-rhamnosyltransferase
MRILIDCTDTFHSQLNTGIQRVVRNIVNHAPSIGRELGVECIPVVLGKTGYTRIEKLNYGLEKRAAFRLRVFLNDAYLKIIRGIVKWSPFPRLNQFLTATKHEFGLTRLILLSLSPLLRWGKRTPTSTRGNTAQFVRPADNDVLLLADSFWNYNFLGAATDAKQRGAVVIAVIYDIIPISHPELVDAKNVTNFEANLPKLYACADGFLGISDFTKSALMRYFQNQPYATDLGAKHFDFFHLGAELDAIDPHGNVRTIIKKPFSTGSSVYLMVGTVEPRKNHKYLLEIFDLLWLKGIQASLVIVGKVGWLCDDIIEAIHSHPMYGARLFFFTDATDAELDYCYSHAKALLFPAIIEGFGLPLIEAQKKGLPVFASDIPVFREVAQDSAAYFDNTNPQALASMLLEYERTGIFPAAGPRGFTWPDWKECTHQMLTRLIAMAQEIQADRSAKQAADTTS